MTTLLRALEAAAGREPMALAGGAMGQALGALLAVDADERKTGAS